MQMQVSHSNFLARMASFPRIQLAHLPTPLELLPRISQALNGPQVIIKRDDCTGLGMGGNKARKLEYLLGEAVSQGARAIVTSGALQSNHVRQTAAAAAMAGLRCHLVLSDSVAGREAAYHCSGNLLLDALFGACIHRLPAGADEGSLMEKLLTALRDQGAKPYLIPVGGSNPPGCLGYIKAAYEMKQQIEQAHLTIDAIVLPTGSTGTQAGLLLGLALLGMSVPVWGISVGRKAAAQEERVKTLLAETVVALDLPVVPDEIPVRVLDSYTGAGYGQPTPGMREAIALFAQMEGILLDPVYTGKAAAGLIDQIRRRAFRADQTVLFWHTGGSPALFAYQQALSAPDLQINLRNTMSTSTTPSPSPLLGSINHLRLSVSNIAAAKAFYRPLLAYLGYEFEKEEPDRLVWAAQDGYGGLRKFILSEAKPELKQRRHDRYAPGLHHFGFNVAAREHVDGFYRLLCEQGVDVLDRPAEYHYQPGYYAVYFADPDGIKLEVVHIPSRY